LAFSTTTTNDNHDHHRWYSPEFTHQIFPPPPSESAGNEDEMVANSNINDDSNNTNCVIRIRFSPLWDSCQLFVETNSNSNNTNKPLGNENGVAVVLSEEDEMNLEPITKRIKMTTTTTTTIDNNTSDRAIELIKERITQFLPPIICMDHKQTNMEHTKK
jgi:hypothetical protein